MSEMKRGKMTMPDGQVLDMIVRYQNVDGEDMVNIEVISPRKEEEVPMQEVKQPAKKPGLRNYLFRSALLRFLYKGRMGTAAITHCTDKAWRVINLEYGAAWVPKNIIKWSDIAQQFCIVEEGYEVDFTEDVHRSMDDYPSIFDPDELIYNEYEV